MNLVSRMNVVKLLVAKNWKIRLHYKKSFALLFLMPILLVALVVIWTYFLRPNIGYTDRYQDVSHSGDRIVYNSSTIFGELRYYNLKEQTLSLYYAPDNSYTNELMQRVAKVFVQKIWLQLSIWSKRIF